MFANVFKDDDAGKFIVLLFLHFIFGVFLSELCLCEETASAFPLSLCICFSCIMSPAGSFLRLTLRFHIHMWTEESQPEVHSFA